MKKAYSVLVLLGLAVLFGCTPQAEEGPDGEMQLHHLHSLMNHGFEMVLQGLT